MQSLKKVAVLYHYPCPDGAFAALAAHLYFSAVSLPVVFFPNPVYNPIRVNSLPLDELSEIYVLDFIGDSGFVAEASSKVKSVTILDHHKTALESLSGNASVLRNVSKVIDMEKSGATIAYDYFNEKLLSSALSSGNHAGRFDIKFLPEDKVQKVHKLFKYIEDGDIWRWALPHSKAFSSGLQDMRIEYNVNVNLSLFDQLMNLDPELVINHGKETLDHKQKLIDTALDQSYEIALGCGLFGHCLDDCFVGQRCIFCQDTSDLAVDADSIPELRSELGHQLANKSHNLNLRSIGAVIYKVPELKNAEKLKISLRSLESEDTTVISKEYRGGGHQNASSFMLSAAEFMKWKV